MLKLSDAAYISLLCFSVLLMSKVLRQRITPYWRLNLLYALGALIAFIASMFGLWLCYFSKSAAGSPWLLAEYGLPWAEYRMALAEMESVDHAWIMENGTLRYLSKREKDFGQTYSVELTSEVRNTEKEQFRKSIQWLYKAAQAGCLFADLELRTLLRVCNPDELNRYMISTSSQRITSAKSCER